MSACEYTLPKREQMRMNIECASSTDIVPMASVSMWFRICWTKAEADAELNVVDVRADCDELCSEIPDRCDIETLLAPKLLFLIP